MGTLMEELALYGAQIFLPLLFQMDQRPLAAAEGKVLKAGEGRNSSSRKFTPSAGR
ncbi:MAG: hypothetical protein ACLRIS_00095 [Flavonifractor plautii]